MKTLSKISFYLGVALIIVFAFLKSIRNIQYNVKMGIEWKDFKEALTVEEKAQHFNNFIQGLEKEDFKGKYDAILFKNELTSFEPHYWALKSYQFNLNNAAKLEYGSSEYYFALKKLQTELSRLDKSISIVKGIYTKHNFILVWRWIGNIIFLLGCFMFVFGIGFQVEYD